MNLYTLKEKITGDTKIVSDNHFGHNKLFEEYEPIRTKVAENLNLFEKTMINRWNKVVSNKDVLLHLGDFCINKRKEEKTIQNIKYNTKYLNGNKILLKGNHDKLKNSIYIENGWDYVIDKPHILLDDEMKILESKSNFGGCVITEINGKRIMFSHFGVFTYDKRFELKYKDEFDSLKELYQKYNCDINIHGHSHSNFNMTKTSFNTSVENINFTPLSVKDIILRVILFK